LITAVKEIGELIIKKENKSLLEIVIEDPATNEKYKRVLAIVFERDGYGVRYKDVELENYSKAKILKYLYRQAGGNSPELTTRLNRKDPEKTLDNKVLGWFKILDEKNFKIESAHRSFLESMRDEIFKNRDKILERIKDSIAQIKKEEFILTIKVMDNGEQKYPGDYDIFRDILLSKLNEKDMEVFERDKTCSICRQGKLLVFGNINTYAFYTLDKPGFIVGGFKEEDAWRNYPVCPECKLALEEGRKFIEENLKFNFVRALDYYLIPNFIMGEDYITKDILNILKKTSREVLLKNETVKKITSDEEEILDILKDEKDVMTLNFLFLQIQNAAERILLLIEDVFPSRIRRLFEAKDYVERIYEEDFTFGNIREFFLKSDSNKGNADLDNYFLDITDRVFSGRPIDYSFLMQSFMRKIRDDFINKEHLYAVKSALMVLAFLEYLNLVEMEVEDMEERIFDGLFKKYGPHFETPLKRGLFLLGALTELLLRKQYSERNAKPFMKNLKSLKMTEKDFKGLLPKVQNKLEEYDSFDKGKRVLAQEAANYLLQAGDNWKMSVDEMNFYYASGMNLVNEVTSILYPEKENSENI